MSTFVMAMPSLKVSVVGRAGVRCDVHVPQRVATNTASVGSMVTTGYVPSPLPSTPPPSAPLSERRCQKHVFVADVERYVPGARSVPTRYVPSTMVPGSRLGGATNAVAV